MKKSDFDITLHWNDLNVDEWPVVGQIFVAAYLAAYKDYSLAEIGLENKNSQASETVISDFFTHMFKIEKNRILATAPPSDIQYVTARLQDTLCAFATAQINPRSGRIYLRWITVDPSVQQRGIGKQLLKAVQLKYPQAHGLELYTRKVNQQSIRFYQQCGLNSTLQFDLITDPNDQQTQCHDDGIIRPPFNDAPTRLDPFLGFYQRFPKS